MTKEELLRENQELKDRIIELQSQIIRLRTIPIPSKEITIKPYYSPPPLTTGDPPPFPYEFICAGGGAGEI